METLGDDQLATRMVWKNAGYSLLSWAVIYLCVAFGLRATGRITYFTMGLPVILLFVFLGRAVSLPGAQAGIQEYVSLLILFHMMYKNLHWLLILQVHSRCELGSSRRWCR